jgi:hypothetical protein
MWNTSSKKESNIEWKKSIMTKKINRGHGDKIKKGETSENLQYIE